MRLESVQSTRPPWRLHNPLACSISPRWASFPQRRYAILNRRSVGLDDAENLAGLGGASQAEPHEHAIPVPLDDVEFADDGGVLGQDPHGPARLGQHGLQAAPT
jgi:hypothetical protein